jgi:hypothetical protein
MAVKIGRFISYKCITCGRWSGKELRNYQDFLSYIEIIKIIKGISCKCTYCMKSFKLRTKGVDSRVLHEWFDSGHEMSRFIQDKNMRD